MDFNDFKFCAGKSRQCRLLRDYLGNVRSHLSSEVTARWRHASSCCACVDERRFQPQEAPGPYQSPRKTCLSLLFFRGVESSTAVTIPSHPFTRICTSAVVCWQSQLPLLFISPFFHLAPFLLSFRLIIWQEAEGIQTLVVINDAVREPTMGK